MDFQRLENFRYLKKAKEICERQIREAIRSLGELTGVNLGGTPAGGNRLSVQERAM